MSWPIALGVIATIAALAWLWWEFKNAPAGFEDERGFHYLSPDHPNGRVIGGACEHGAGTAALSDRSFHPANPSGED